MGLIDRAMGVLFGQGNVIAETAEVFRENAEKAGEREAALSAAALAQFAAEFASPRRCLFDSVLDGLNRLPRPAMALGTLALFGAAMVDPVWFSSRMVGLALVPEPLWWLLGAVVSFYFGARHQAKGQEFRRSLAATLARTPDVAAQLAALKPHSRPEQPHAPAAETLADVPPPSARPAAATAQAPSGNAALDDWRASHG